MGPLGVLGREEREWRAASQAVHRGKGPRHCLSNAGPASSGDFEEGDFVFFGRGKFNGMSFIFGVSHERREKPGIPGRMRLLGLVGIRIGEASHPGPHAGAGGSRRTARRRQERVTGYNGMRVGEASNPGPALDSGQLGTLIALIQSLLQILTQLAAGQGGDLATPIETVSRTVRGLQEQGGKANGKDKGKGGGTAPTSATTARASEGDGWSLVQRGRGKGAAAKGEEKGKGRGSPTPRPAPRQVTSAALRASDWTGKLLTVEELASYQGVGEGIVIGARDENQALVAEAMVAGGGLQSSVVLAYPHPEGKTRLPFWTEAGVTMRAAVLKEFPFGTVAVPRLKGKSTSMQTIKAEETEIVRVILARDLTDEKTWKEALRGFRGFVMARLAVTDAWGAAEERRLGPVVVGLARVKKSLIAAALGRSGQDGLFVEPTGRTSSFGVTWLDTKEGEAVDDYFRRVAAIKSKWGMVMGRRQLGHRTETPADQQVRSWRVPGAPRHWDAEVVKEILEEAGFTQVVVTSRMVRKGAATWFVRAAGKEDLATIGVKEGAETVEIFVLPAQTARRQGFRAPLARERPLTFAREQFATVIGAKETTAKDETGKEVPAGKKAKLELRAVPAGATLKPMPRDGNCLAHSVGQGLTFLKQDAKQRPARLVRAEIHAYMKRKAEEFAGFWDGRNTADEEGKLANFAEYLAEMAGDGRYLGCLELTAACRAFDLTLIVVPVAAKDPPTRHGTGQKVLALWYHGDHYDLLLPEDVTKGYPAAITGVTAFGVPAGGRGGGGEPDDEVDAMTVYTQASGGGVCVRQPVQAAGSEHHHDQEVDALTVYTRATGGGARVRRPAEAGGSRGPAAVHTLQAAFRASSVRAASETGPRDIAVSSLKAATAGDQVAAVADGGEAEEQAGTIATQELDIADFIEEVPDLVPPPPRATRHNGHVRSTRGRELRSSWPCPECGWIATGRHWHQLKTAHIRKHHPDLAGTLGKEEKRAVFVPWSPTCCWKCPVAGCGMGMKDDGTSGQWRHTMRMQHRREHHPEEPKELFYINGGPQDRTGNAAKASIACRNRGAANRIRGLRAAQAGGHKPCWVSYPIPPPKGKRKRAWHETLVHRIFCKQCCHIAAKAEVLAGRDCVLGYVSGTLPKMLKRLRARLEEDATDEIRAAIEHTIATIEPTLKEEAAEHHQVEAVAWPGDEWTVKFLCHRCGTLADAEANIKGKCSRLGARRPTRAVGAMRDIVSAEDGARAKAARYNLERLGYPIRHNDADTATAQLAAGLRQGP